MNKPQPSSKFVGCMRKLVVVLMQVDLSAGEGLHMCEVKVR